MAACAAAFPLCWWTPAGVRSWPDERPNTTATAAADPNTRRPIVTTVARRVPVFADEGTTNISPDDVVIAVSRDERIGRSPSRDDPSGRTPAPAS